MKMHRMLASASAVLLVAAVGCGGGGDAPAGADATAPPAAPATSDAVTASAAATPAPDAEAASRPRLIAPYRGEAEIGFTQPQPRRDGTMVVTRFRLKNLAGGPIAGLRIDEFWYDQSGNPTGGDTYRHPKPLQPDEVIEVTLRTPASNISGRPNYKFEHANGKVKPTVMQKLD